jgi:hypothetical protein
VNFLQKKGQITKIKLNISASNKGLQEVGCLGRAFYLQKPELKGSSTLVQNWVFMFHGPMLDSTYNSIACSVSY